VDYSSNKELCPFYSIRSERCLIENLRGFDLRYSQQHSRLRLYIKIDGTEYVPIQVKKGKKSLSKFTEPKEKVIESQIRSLNLEISRQLFSTRTVNTNDLMIYWLNGVAAPVDLIMSAIKLTVNDDSEKSESFKRHIRTMIQEKYCTEILTQMTAEIEPKQKIIIENTTEIETLLSGREYACTMSDDEMEDELLEIEQSIPLIPETKEELEDHKNWYDFSSDEDEESVTTEEEPHMSKDLIKHLESVRDENIYEGLSDDDDFEFTFIHVENPMAAFDMKEVESPLQEILNFSPMDLANVMDNDVDQAENLYKKKLAIKALTMSKYKIDHPFINRLYLIYGHDLDEYYSTETKYVTSNKDLQNLLSILGNDNRPIKAKNENVIKVQAVVF